ncbi:TROVE domain-containing protein (fragment) [uncultured Pleomorphomonas sp.]|uniref:TROVE domain-containing protein n=1 Tax=uncultured Pleomorphomonas sp. TaxID=442121 RepID=A0A212L252_9HYPH
MKLNTKPKFTETTHEGAPAARMTPEQALRRSVMSCLLWEREFYEDGEDIAGRIERLCGEVPPFLVSNLAREARSSGLRHVPLLLLCGLIKRGNGALVAETIEQAIQRADELTELLAIYWRKGKTPQVLSLGTYSPTEERR